MMQQNNFLWYNGIIKILGNAPFNQDIIAFCKNIVLIKEKKYRQKMLFVKHLQFLFFLKILSIVILPVSLYSQTNLSQNFRFESGVYLTYETFQKNTPSYPANDIIGNFFVNDKTKQAKVEFIRLKSTNENLDLNKMWGIVIKGIPYVKTSPNLPEHSLKVFASMEVRGNICYYAYDDIEEKEITFKAYNPLIGKPFRTGKAMRKIPVIKEKMLRFTTGEVADFNFKNLLEWTAEDTDIPEALKSLGETKAEEKLFDALLLFNDKHPVAFPIAN